MTKEQQRLIAQLEELHSVTREMVQAQEKVNSLLTTLRTETQWSEDSHCYKGQWYKPQEALRSGECKGCAFVYEGCKGSDTIHPACSLKRRKDGRDIVWVLDTETQLVGTPEPKLLWEQSTGSEPPIGALCLIRGALYTVVENPDRDCTGCDIGGGCPLAEGQQWPSCCADLRKDGKAVVFQKYQEQKEASK